MSAEPGRRETAPVEPPRTDKSDRAFRTISEVAEELDVPAHVLRFWETKFPQISPLKRGGRRRYYRPADLALLRGVRRLLYDEGLTIKGLQKVFRERGLKYVVAIGAGEALDPAPEADAPAATAAPEMETGSPRARRLLAIAATLETIRDALRAV